MLPTTPGPAQPPRAPLFQISLANAVLLSVLYLAMAAFTDLSRRFFTWRWAEFMSEAMEEFPARSLRWFGLFSPLRRAYLAGDISALQVRFLLGLTMVAVIFGLALGVGALMWVGREVYERTQKRQTSD